MSNPYAGAPSWADPNQQGTPWPTPTPPRSHGLSVTTLIVSGVALVLSVVALAMLVLGGGGSYTMRCPAMQAVAPGGRTTCTSRIDGGKGSVEVSFTDTAGHFTLDLP